MQKELQARIMLHSLPRYLVLVNFFLQLLFEALADGMGHNFEFLPACDQAGEVELKTRASLTPPIYATVNPPWQVVIGTMDLSLSFVVAPIIPWGS